MWAEAERLGRFAAGLRLERGLGVLARRRPRPQQHRPHDRRRNGVETEDLRDELLDAEGASYRSYRWIPTEGKCDSCPLLPAEERARLQRERWELLPSAG